MLTALVLKSVCGRISYPSVSRINLRSGRREALRQMTGNISPTLSIQRFDRKKALTSCQKGPGSFATSAMPRCGKRSIRVVMILGQIQQKIGIEPLLEYITREDMRIGLLRHLRINPGLSA
jgi:hypothetical protein